MDLLYRKKRYSFIAVPLFLLLLFNIFGQLLFWEFECHCILIEKQIMTDLLASHGLY